MSQLRFLADHDFNEHVIQGVARREPGLEFVRARDVGMSQAPDRQLLEYAASHGFVVISHDVNTMSAAAADMVNYGEPMLGLFLVHQFQPIGAVINSILITWGASAAEEYVGRIVYLPP